MASNQEARHAAVRAMTGTDLGHNGDWHALFDSAAIPSGDFNGRMLTWLSRQGGCSSDGGVVMAQGGFASAAGAYGWDGVTALPVGAPTQLGDEFGSIITDGVGNDITATSGQLTQSGSCIKDDTGDILSDEFGNNIVS
jgi:hypothetical protein